MIGWIVHGLGKVVPQPDEKYKGHTEPEVTTEVKTDSIKSQLRVVLILICGLIFASSGLHCSNRLVKDEIVSQITIMSHYSNTYKKKDVLSSHRPAFEMCQF